MTLPDQELRFVKDHADTEEEEIDLIKTPACWTLDPEELPRVVPAKGLSAERQWYLYDSIGPFLS